MHLLFSQTVNTLRGWRKEQLTFIGTRVSEAQHEPLGNMSPRPFRNGTIRSAFRKLLFFFLLKSKGQKTLLLEWLTCQTRYFYHRELKGRIWNLWCKRKDSKYIAITSRGVEDESLEIYHYQPPKLSSTLVTRIPVFSDFLLNPGTIGKRLQYTGRPTLYHCIQPLQEAHLSFNNYSDEQPQPHFLIFTLSPTLQPSSNTCDFTKAFMLLCLCTH